MLISIIILVLVVAFAILGFFFNVLNSILYRFSGLFKRGSKTGSDSNGSNAGRQPRQTMHGQGRKKRKVIDSTDGEYVDFEEIKQ